MLPLLFADLKGDLLGDDLALSDPLPDDFVVALGIDLLGLDLGEFDLEAFRVPAVLLDLDRDFDGDFGLLLLLLLLLLSSSRFDRMVDLGILEVLSSSMRPEDVRLSLPCMKYKIGRIEIK